MTQEKVINSSKEYLVQIKGITENKNCWKTETTKNTWKEAFSFYKKYGGCSKRIIKEVKKTTHSIMIKEN